MPKKRKYTIMQEFKITEISAVDNPAQKGAKALILKRDDQEFRQQEVQLFFDHFEECRRNNDPIIVDDSELTRLFPDEEEKFKVTEELSRYNRLLREASVLEAERRRQRVMNKFEKSDSGLADICKAAQDEETTKEYSSQAYDQAMQYYQEKQGKNALEISHDSIYKQLHKAFSFMRCCENEARKASTGEFNRAIDLATEIRAKEIFGRKEYDFGKAVIKARAEGNNEIDVLRSMRR